VPGPCFRVLTGQERHVAEAWMLKRLRFVTVLAALIGAASLTVAVAHAESINEALAAAYQYNPQLDAERARLRATDENVAIANSRYRPSITGQADFGRQTLDTRPSNDQVEGVTSPKTYSLSASQLLFDGFQTQNAVGGAEAGVRAGRETLRNVEQQVLLDAATAYMDTVRDQAIVRLRESNVASLTTELKATQDRFAVGEVTRTDVAQSQARRASAISALDLAQANLKTSRANYERVIGHPPGNLVEPASAGSEVPKSLSEASAIGARESPSVVSALFLELQARHQVDEIRGELLPQVSVNANYTDSIEPSVSFSEQERASITGRVFVPIYENGGEVYARVRQAKHTHISRLQEVEQRRTEVQASVISAWSQLEAARAQMQSDKVQVDSSQIALTGVREEERVGQRTLLDVLDAQLELVNAQVTQVGTRRNVVVNGYAVLQAIGRLEMSQLGLTAAVYDPVVHADEVRRKWFGLSITHEDGHTERVDAWEADHVPAK
jgi:outer membrane protein